MGLAAGATALRFSAFFENLQIFEKWSKSASGMVFGHFGRQNRIPHAKLYRSIASNHFFMNFSKFRFFGSQFLLIFGLLSRVSGPGSIPIEFGVKKDPGGLILRFFGHAGCLFMPIFRLYLSYLR